MCFTLIECDKFHQKHSKADMKWRYRTGDRGYTDDYIEKLIERNAMLRMFKSRAEINYFVKEMQIQLIKAWKETRGIGNIRKLRRI